MGGYLTTTWYTYARDKEDNWLSEPLDSTVAKSDNILHHMGKFKHKVFQLALGQNFSETPKIYLYQGTRRVKCHQTEDTMIITFSDTEAKKAWEHCRRSKLGLKVDEKYEAPEGKDTFVHIFKKKKKVTYLEASNLPASG